MGNEDDKIKLWAKMAEDFYGSRFLFEMSRVGCFSDFEVWVRTDDGGNIPHFHVWDKNSRGGLFHTCVQIAKPEYFRHTDKENVFNARQKHELVDFLRAKLAKSRWHSTNWDFIVTLWNANNLKAEVPEDIEIPDYSKL